MMRTALAILVLLAFSCAAFAGKVDHSKWDALLKKHVSDAGNVNYAGFKADQTELKAYTDVLASHVPAADWSENEKLAYWINVYNAFTVQLIVDHYPTSSIKDLLGGAPWDHKFISLGGTTYSLNHVEHEILRKEFNEPRIHFAINCASESCPILSNKAYTSANVQDKLAAAARRFINDSTKNKLSSNKAELSSLFTWFHDDFTKQGTVIAFINKYSETKVNSTAAVSYLEYSWKLNE